MNYIDSVIKKEWEYNPYDNGGGYWEKRFGNITVLYCDKDGLILFFETDAGTYKTENTFEVVSLIAKLHASEEPSLV